MTDAYTPLPNSSDLDKAAEAAVIRAKEWLALTNNAASKKEAASTEQLAALVRDDDGIRFTMGFVDRVARPTDNTVAAGESIQNRHSQLYWRRGQGLGECGRRRRPYLPLARHALGPEATSPNGEPPGA